MKMRRFLKKRLGRSLVLIGLAVLCTFTLVANANADSWVGAATIRTSTNGATTVGDAGNGGIIQINANSSNGNQFINDVTTNVAFSGTPNDYRLVGSNLLSTYSAGDGSTFMSLYNGRPIVAVFAVSGTAIPVLGNPTVFDATGGRVGFFSINAVTDYNVNKPTTWGATNAAGTSLLTPIAVWDLKPREIMHDCPVGGSPGDFFCPPGTPAGGGPGIFNKLASQMNQISINATVGDASQGFFMFKENGVFPTLEDSDFVNLLTNPLPGGVGIEAEGIVTRTDESIKQGTAINTAGINTATVDGTDGFNALNTIAKQLGGMADLVGGCSGVGCAFATGFGGLGNSGGLATDFNPSSASSGNIPNTADVLDTLGTTSSAFAEPVPEPATIVLFLGGGLVIFSISAFQRFRGKRNEVG
jgi:hypothetical protein